MEHTFVEVKFLEGYNNKSYYFKNGHEGIEIGDPVLVDTIHGYRVGMVLSLPETVERNVGKWVAAKLDFTRFEEIQDIRAQEKENKMRKSELKRHMKAKFEKEVMPSLIEKYAEENEEMAALLKEYNAL